MNHGANSLRRQGEPIHVAVTLGGIRKAGRAKVTEANEKNVVGSRYDEKITAKERIGETSVPMT